MRLKQNVRRIACLALAVPFSLNCEIQEEPLCVSSSFDFLDNVPVFVCEEDINDTCFEFLDSFICLSDEVDDPGDGGSGEQSCCLTSDEPGCNDGMVQMCVCAFGEFASCCTSSWDGSCVDQAVAACDLTCD
jgi:hypothetical protein